MGTLTARDVAEETVAGVDLAASQAGFKAREAYLRWFSDHTWGPTPKGRNAALGLTQRFGWVVETLIRLRKEHHVQTEFSVASIARALGHADPSTLDAYMRFEQPVSFNDGDRLCELYHVDRQWLETGERHPFYQRALYHDAGEMFRELYKNGCFFDHLIFVLGDERRGECSVFGVNNSHEYTLLAHDIPVHDDVGGGGHMDVMQFVTLLGAIVPLKNGSNHFFSRASGSTLYNGFIRSYGIILTPEDYRSAEYGHVHPAQLLSGRNSHTQPWHEDLPDLEYGESGMSPYTESYARARELYRRDLEHKKITTNKQLNAHIQEIVGRWQPTDFDLAQMLQKKDGDAQPWEHYSNIVKAAQSGDEKAHLHIITELFWNTRIAMPDWIEYSNWFDAHPEHIERRRLEIEAQRALEAEAEAEAAAGN